MFKYRNDHSNCTVTFVTVCYIHYSIRRFHLCSRSCHFCRGYWCVIDAQQAQTASLTTEDEAEEAKRRSSEQKKNNKNKHGGDYTVAFPENYSISSSASSGVITSVMLNLFRRDATAGRPRHAGRAAPLGASLISGLPHSTNAAPQC